MHVVRLVADYPVGGMASYGLQPVYYNLSRAQANEGHEVDVIARKSPNQPPLESFGGVTVHRVGAPFTVNAFLALRALMPERSDTVIHTHSTSGVFLAGMKQTTRAPIVSHVHGTTYSMATPAILQFGSLTYGYSSWGVTTSYLREKALWRAADRIAAVSTSVVSDLASRYGIGKEKVRLVYNGVDPSLFRESSEPNGGPFPSVSGKVVLYVGHFGLRKGIPILLEAMKSIADKVKDSYLLCVGGIPPWLPQAGYMTYLNGLAERYGLKDRVHFHDRVSQNALPAIYSRASVFVLPSYYEAFPKVLIEAMACGVPVVATKPGGTVDSVEEGSNGFLVPYGDSKALADRVVALLQDGGLSRRMGANGKERVLREFTWEAVARRLDRVYDEVLQG
jgi:1,2-diacylglycerol 3-alpha-glucosyltransferase